MFFLKRPSAMPRDSMKSIVLLFFFPFNSIILFVSSTMSSALIGPSEAIKYTRKKRRTFGEYLYLPYKLSLDTDERNFLFNRSFISGMHVNIVEKSVLVILNKVSKGKLKKYNTIKAVDSYYNHAEKGANLLKQFNVYDKEFLDTVRYHHNNNVVGNKLLEIIRESDNRN